MGQFRLIKFATGPLLQLARTTFCMTDITTAAGTPVSHHVSRCVLFVPKSFASDAAECLCMDSRPGFNSNPAIFETRPLIKIRYSDSRLLFEPRPLYRHIYGIWLDCSRSTDTHDTCPLHRAVNRKGLSSLAFQLSNINLQVILLKSAVKAESCSEQLLGWQWTNANGHNEALTVATIPHLLSDICVVT